MNHFDKQIFVNIWFSFNSVETHIEQKMPTSANYALTSIFMRKKLNLEEKVFKFSSQLNYNCFTFEFLHLGKSKPFPHCDVCVIWRRKRRFFAQKTFTALHCNLILQQASIWVRSHFKKSVFVQALSKLSVLDTRMLEHFGQLF